MVKDRNGFRRWLFFRIFRGDSYPPYARAVSYRVDFPGKFSRRENFSTGTKEISMGGNSRYLFYEECKFNWASLSFLTFYGFDIFKLELIWVLNDRKKS